MSDFTPFLLKIRQWLEEAMDAIRFGVEWSCNLRIFLEENVPETWDLIKEAAKESLATAMTRLHSLKDIILKKCKEHEVLLRSLLVKLGVKAGIKLGAQVAVKQTTRFGVKTVLKSASNPIGLIADGTQAGLEVMGYNDAAKKVGAGGNAAGGAIAGFALGGPPGAALGAAVGTGIWFVGEVVGGLF